jgi:hypothetical protein
VLAKKHHLAIGSFGDDEPLGFISPTTAGACAEQLLQMMIVLIVRREHPIRFLGFF